MSPYGTEFHTAVDSSSTQPWLCPDTSAVSSKRAYWRGQLSLPMETYCESHDPCRSVRLPRLTPGYFTGRPRPL